MLHSFRYRIAIILADGLRIRVAVLETWSWKEPVKVRVRDLRRIPAVLAAPARSLALGRAQEQLPEPQSKALLSDAARTVKQNAARKCASERGQPQALA